MRDVKMNYRDKYSRRFNTSEFLTELRRYLLPVIIKCSAILVLGFSLTVIGRELYEIAGWLNVCNDPLKPLWDKTVGVCWGNL